MVQEKEFSNKVTKKVKEAEILAKRLSEEREVEEVEVQGKKVSWKSHAETLAACGKLERCNHHGTCKWKNMIKDENMRSADNSPAAKWKMVCECEDSYGGEKCDEVKVIKRCRKERRGR